MLEVLPDHRPRIVRAQKRKTKRSSKNTKCRETDRRMGKREEKKVSVQRDA